MTRRVLPPAKRKAAFWSVLAVATLAMLVVLVYQRQVEQRMQLSQTQLNAAYDSIISGYAEFADVAHDWIVQDRQAQPLIQQLYAGAPAARGQLYRHLYPFYESLRTKHVRQLHFIARDGRSLLRMHAPEVYGDQLFDVRPLLRQAVAEDRPVSGFENGRVFHGFRYIYPVHDRGALAGVMEVSLSFTAIRRLLAKSVPENTHIRFLLKRDDLLRVMDTGKDAVGTRALFSSLYQPSAVHPDYVIEDLEHPLYGEPRETVAESTRRTEALLGRDSRTREALSHGTALARHLCQDLSHCELVNLLPVRGADGRTVAFVLAHTQDTTQPGRVTLLGGVLLAGAILLSGLALVLSNWLHSREQMRVINEHVGKGIYVVDVQGVIVYANPAAAAILGFKVSEMLGRHAHGLLHAESHGQSVAAGECPILHVATHGMTYQSASELFKRRDGTPIPVEVTASPIRELGTVTGVVTLFSDMRERLAVEARLRQSDAAFKQAAEGVMITDAVNRIVAVNQAFTSLTGYTEPEVLGRTPAMLSSGRHAPEFYRRMWSDIASNGQWQGEIYNRRKDGSVYPEWLSIAAIRDSQGVVTNYVAVFNDISDIKEKEARLDFMAHHDTLTGLPNRLLFADRLGHALARAERTGTGVAVLFLDLDRFKQVNDSLGHDAGDRLLAECAQRLVACLRKEDTLGRQGGDEFVMLLESLSDGRDAAQVAGKVIQALKPAFSLHGHEVYVGGSIGISLAPDDASDAVTLLKHADSAMYHAKAAGGDTWRFFNPAQAEFAVERLTLEAELRRALERDEFALHYQPCISLGDGRPHAMEALLRWHHPTRGLRTPGEFLQVARSAGMMVELGAWVMRTAVRQIAAWQLAGLEVMVNVNVDGSQLGKDILWDLVSDVLAQSGIRAGLLGLEITETAIMDPQGGDLDKLDRLRSLGVGVYIDDFGTGHSSLARLKQMPISVLKVDAAFVRDMVEDASDRAIVRATVALAHELDLKVVAEGVETVAQLRLLRDIGCDGVQGYLLARPMPADEATAYLRDPPGAPV